MFAEMRNQASMATVARTLSTVRQLCRWAHRRDLTTADPCREISVPSPGKSQLPVRAISDEDLAALRAAVYSQERGPRAAWAVRDRAVLEMLVGCGLRASELCQLRVKELDTNLERALLHLNSGTKGSRSRDVPVPDEALTSIDGYMSERVNILGKPQPQDRLFVRRNGATFDRGFLDRLVRDLASIAGVEFEPGTCAHALRHHYGSQLALRGVPVPVIQELLGHQDSRTTARYTRLAPAQLINALDDAGWLRRPS